MGNNTSDPTAGTAAYDAFARELLDTSIITDPWIAGVERFRLEPVVLSADLYARFVDVVEAVGRLWDETVRMLYADEALLERHFHLTPWQKAMWIASGGEWHGIARADAFLLSDGRIQICELNADTPSGEPEAVLLNRLRHRHHPDLIDPNAGFEERFVAMVASTYRAEVGRRAQERPTLGILYPTDLPEDLSMIELYRTWFSARGWSVVYGSPFNLTRDAAGRLRMLDRAVDVVIRHYKTDWWSEREPVTTAEPEFLDPDALVEPLQAILGAELDGRVAVVNPFGSVVAQNKLALAFMHAEIDRFSDDAQRTIRAHVPLTLRLSSTDIDAIRGERERWVLKSDYGCEGDEVVIGRTTTPEIWERTLDEAIAERWIAQEYFDAATTPEGMIPNYGLFLVGGRAGGIFTRFSPGTTDYRAVTAPTFVEGNRD